VEKAWRAHSASLGYNKVESAWQSVSVFLLKFFVFYKFSSCSHATSKRNVTASGSLKKQFYSAFTSVSSALEVTLVTLCVV